MIVACAKKVDEKKTVHAFVVMQGFLREIEQSQQRGSQQNGRTAPPPRVARVEAFRHGGKFA